MSNTITIGIHGDAKVGKTTLAMCWDFLDACFTAVELPKPLPKTLEPRQKRRKLGGNTFNVVVVDNPSPSGLDKSDFYDTNILVLVVDCSVTEYKRQPQVMDVSHISSQNLPAWKERFSKVPQTPVLIVTKGEDRAKLDLVRQTLGTFGKQFIALMHYNDEDWASMEKMYWRTLRFVLQNGIYRFTIKIHLIRGKDLLAKDRSGYSDPYVIFKNNFISAKSKYKKKTLFPEWDEIILMDINGRLNKLGNLKVKCMDHDKHTKDDLIGTALVDLSEALLRMDSEPLVVDLVTKNKKPAGSIVLAMTLQIPSSGAKKKVVSMATEKRMLIF